MKTSRYMLSDILYMLIPFAALLFPAATKSIGLAMTLIIGLSVVSVLFTFAVISSGMARAAMESEKQNFQKEYKKSILIEEAVVSGTATTGYLLCGLWLVGVLAAVNWLLQLVLVRYLRS